jgi:hypothetical protein
MINFITEPAETYHSMRGNGIDDGKFFSSHMLIDYLNNQKLFKRVHIDKAIIKEESQALKKGTAIHRCVLEKGADFVNEYTVGYPTHEVKGVLQEYGADTKFVKEWMASLPKNKPFISTQEMQDILKINELVKENDFAKQVIEESEIEQVLRVNYEGINCQIRIDAYYHLRGIYDLKKTRKMSTFLRDADKYGYWIQAGFYSKIFEVATGFKTNFSWIVVEDVEPFEVCIFDLDASHLEYAQRCVESGILEYKESFKNNQWLTGREGINIATWYKAEQNEGIIE